MNVYVHSALYLTVNLTVDVLMKWWIKIMRNSIFCCSGGDSTTYLAAVQQAAAAAAAQQASIHVPLHGSGAGPSSAQADLHLSKRPRMDLPHSSGSLHGQSGSGSRHPGLGSGVATPLSIDTAVKVGPLTSLLAYAMPSSEPPPTT